MLLKRWRVVGGDVMLKLAQEASPFWATCFLHCRRLTFGGGMEFAIWRYGASATSSVCRMSAAAYT